MFSKSAHLYDAVYDWVDYEAGAAQIHSRIQERKPGASTLLDVACGTGTHLAHLGGWYRCEGVDLDPGMLDVARSKLPDIALHEKDMIDFDLGRRFDAVICMFSSITYMRTADRMDRAIANMARHLEAGGVLIVEPFIRPEDWKEGLLGADFVDQPDLKVARMSWNTRDGQLIDLEFHYLVLTAEGVEYFTETHEGALFTDDEYQSAFEKAGLRVEYVAGGPVGRGLYIGVS